MLCRKFVDTSDVIPAERAAARESQIPENTKTNLDCRFSLRLIRPLADARE
jgi:hypothetical protein